MSLSKKAVVKMTVRNGVRSLLPLPIRKHLSLWVHHQTWLDAGRRAWWSQELVRDLADRDINEYHKFLWSNHLSYAVSYEVASRFGQENMKQSRKLFFADLKEHLAALSLDPGTDVRSAYEVGCSLGYQLRYLETDLFTAASVLEGIDIDAYAIQAGTAYLKSIGSAVRLQCGDMEHLEQVLGARRYDVILCCGVLMYLDEETAGRLVETLLRHTNIMLAFTGLAHPDNDNAQLGHSAPRESDRSYIHNVDAMVEQAGGKVVARRWEGSTLLDGHTIYSVFATGTRVA